MSKSILRVSQAYYIIIIVVFCSCKDDSYLTESLPLPSQDFTESFDIYQSAYDKGWRALNKSTPAGRKWYDVTETPIVTSPNYVAVYYPEWNQAQLTLDSLQFGLNTPFPERYWTDAYASQKASNGYVATSMASAEVLNLTGPSVPYTINNWLVSPEVRLQNGDKITFYSYCKGVARLQLWINETNTLNVGNTALESGDFTIKLLDINPAYDSVATNPVRAFPQDWTRFECVVQGLKDAVQGRFGFRYLVENGKPFPSSVTPDELYNGIHESVIGIDEVSLSGGN